MVEAAELRRRYMLLGLEEAARAMADLATVLQQTDQQIDEARLGSIALGFKRAATNTLGNKFEVDIDPKHVNEKGT